MPKQTLSRDQRLTRSALIREAYRQERSFVGRYMVLYLREGEDATLRLGVVSSKKVGGAVQRNRARRRLREAYRRCRAWFSGPFDVVLIARGYVLRASWPQVVHEMLELAAQAGLIERSRCAEAEQSVLGDCR